MILDVFLYAVHAILPILILMAIGYGVARTGMFDRAYFRTMNKFVFKILFPVNLFISAYSIEDLSLVNLPAVLYVVFGIFLCLGLGLVMGKLFIPQYNQKGVIAQAAFRGNQTVLGLSVAESLGGGAADAMGFAALCTAVGIPFYNILAVTVLTIFSGDPDKKPDIPGMLKKIARNPLIIGALSGLACVLFEQLVLPAGADGLPVFSLRYSLPDLYDAISRMSKATLPIALFVLGTLLDFSKIGEQLKPIAVGVITRLFLSPLLVMGLAILVHEPLHLGTAEFPTILTFSATPVAIASVAMTQEIGGDDALAAQIVVWSSVISMGTMIVYVFILRMLGLL